MWVEFVGSRPSCDNFSLRVLGFPPSTKTNTSKLQFDPLERTDTFEQAPEFTGAPLLNKSHLRLRIFCDTHPNTAEISKR